MHPSPSVLASVVILAAVVAFFAIRPRLLLLPLVWGFALVAWMRVWMGLPVVLRDLLAARALEAQAAALHHHAQTAQALWTTNADFRPAARELFERVATGYNLSLRGRGGMDLHPRDAVDAGNMASSFGALSVAAAAGAVNESKGAPIQKATGKQA